MSSTKWTAVSLSVATLVALTVGGCPQPTPTGDAAAGQALFNARCIGCHPNPADVSANAATNDLGTLSPAMSGILLSDQEVANVKAFLANPPSDGSGNGGGGDATAGGALFATRCAVCHPAAQVASDLEVVTNNMGTVNVAMTGITLTDQEVLDVKAYLATQ